MSVDTTPATTAIPTDNPWTRVDWKGLFAVLSTIGLAFMGGLHYAPPTPTPTPPQVMPDTTNELPPKHTAPDDGKAPQPKPDTKPDTKPEPDPTPSVIVKPIVTPTLIDYPVASITISSQGRPITDADTVGPGQQLTLSSERSIHASIPGSLVWTVDPPLQQFVTPDGSTLVITTPQVSTTIKVQQIVCIGGKLANCSITIKSGQAAQPPPITPAALPVPVIPPAAVVPVVQPGLLSIVVVHDPLTTDQVTGPVINDLKLWNGYQAKGHKFRLFSPSTTEINGIAAVNAARAAGVSGSALVISNLATGALVKALPLPTSIPAVQSTISSYGG